MPIHPLPQFEADVKELLDERDRLEYEALKAPRTVVVRFGSMKLIGEFQLPQGSTIKPGCGSKLIVRTFRGTELGEMLTSTCPNSGCSKSVSRQDMLQYIENSGGKDYPFYTEGRVLRVATAQDIDAQSRLEQHKHAMKLEARRIVEGLVTQGGHDDLGKLKIIEVEPVLGGESVTVYFMSESRVEFRVLARELGRTFGSRVELRVVGARDEARLTADYEKCGQYCCCKNFLKVLSPVSMKNAKVQKATLDPVKISGRCGRLMCCLRYEEQTYDDLAKRLPRRKSRVGTPEGDGFVIDTQILTQLVLVLLDTPGDDGKERQVAVPVEDLSEPKDPKGPDVPLHERLKRGHLPPPSAVPTPTESRPAPRNPERAPRDDAPHRGDTPREQRRPHGAPSKPASPPPRVQRPRTRDEEIDELMGEILDDAPRPQQSSRPRHARGPKRRDDQRRPPDGPSRGPSDGPPSGPRPARPG